MLVLYIKNSRYINFDYNFVRSTKSILLIILVNFYRFKSKKTILCHNVRDVIMLLGTGAMKIAALSRIRKFAL